MRIIYFVIPDSVWRFLGVGSVCYPVFVAKMHSGLEIHEAGTQHSTAQPAGQTGHESVHSAKHS